MSSDHLVVLVHGIRTRAAWLHSMRNALEARGFTVEYAGYGVFGLPQFLLPTEMLRKRPITRVRRRLDAAISINKPKKTSIIAHSFGSYIVAGLLREKKYKFHRVIFCGSVVSQDFPFHECLECFDPPIINEVGSSDV
jgi:alpha-beta hydrolase superfamily lysophospholipase